MRTAAILVLASACGFDPGAMMPDAPAAPRADADDGDEQGGSTLDAAFAPDACPDTYTMIIGATSSRYRGVGTEAAFAQQHAACNADRPGWTHLASPETAAELIALRDELQPRTLAPSRKYYIGIVQPQNQAAVDAGWLVFTGGALPAALWSSGQPNDDGAPESNDENRGTLNADDMLNDATGDLGYGAICECDGQAIAPAIAALVP